jgi:hypothetical protein
MSLLGGTVQQTSSAAYGKRTRVIRTDQATNSTVDDAAPVAHCTQHQGCHNRTTLDVHCAKTTAPS